jgi:hypothetical protein
MANVLMYQAESLAATRPAGETTNNARTDGGG